MKLQLWILSLSVTACAPSAPVGPAQRDAHLGATTRPPSDAVAASDAAVTIDAPRGDAEPRSPPIDRGSSSPALFGRGVSITEQVRAQVDDGAFRYQVVEVRCHDLWPRGGSDCVDRGYQFLRWALRSTAVPTGRRLWERPLALGDLARPRLALEGGALCVTSSSSVHCFATRDGAPSPAAPTSARASR